MGRFIEPSTLLIIFVKAFCSPALVFGHHTIGPYTTIVLTTLVYNYTRRYERSPLEAEQDDVVNEAQKRVDKTRMCSEILAIFL